MKRFLSLFLMFYFISAIINAQVIADGYYRVKNNATGRYVTVIDDYGYIDFQSTSADMGAIQTYSNFETRVLTNPASIIYSEYNKSNGGYIFHCQGTNTYKIIGHYLSISNRYGCYQLYASNGVMTSYLRDKTNSGKDSSVVVTDSKDAPSANMNWIAEKITNNDNSCFGVQPTIQIGENYYASFYASFPFSFYSSGMKAYYVSKVDTKLAMAIWKEITTTDIPSATPVIIKCSSNNPYNNKLDIHKSIEKSVSDNILKGVYFCRDRNQVTNPHRDVLENDTSTMRVLGKLSDGSVGLKKSSNKYISKNSAYLIVPKKSPNELKLVTQEEYDKLSQKKVSSIKFDKTSLELTLGTTSTLSLTIQPTDATDKSVSWTSSDASIATVTNGEVKALKVGTVTITAKTLDGSNLSAKCSIKVNPILATAISLDKTSTELKIGESITLQPNVLPINTTDKSVAWTTSDASIATITNGVVNALKVGTVTITAKTLDGSNLSAKCSIKVNPILATAISLDKTSTELKIGESITLQPNVLPINTTDKSVAWTTSDASIASVTNGEVKALKVGTVTITAKTLDGSNLSASCSVKVNPILATGISLDKTSTELKIGESITLQPNVLPINTTDKSVAWTTSDASIASVTNGVVNALKVGTVTITAKTLDGSNLSATCSVKVNPILVESVTLSEESIELVIGKDSLLEFALEPENATNKSLKWSTTDENIATVVNGRVYAHNIGKVTITVVTQDGSDLEASCIVNVVYPTGIQVVSKKKQLNNIYDTLGKRSNGQFGGFHIKNRKLYKVK